MRFRFRTIKPTQPLQRFGGLDEKQVGFTRYKSQAVSSPDSIFGPHLVVTSASTSIPTPPVVAPVVSTSKNSFEDAVRALARQEGHPGVKSDTPVTVVYGTTQSGHSEYTVTSTWEELEVTCGTFTRHYTTPAAGFDTASPLNAFAALLADLDTPRTLPDEAATLAGTAGVGPWEAIDQYAADPDGSVAAWAMLAGLRERVYWSDDGKGNAVPDIWDRVATYALDWTETFYRNDSA